MCACPPASPLRIRYLGSLHGWPVAVAVGSKGSGVLAKFLIYGLIGWVIEVCFTGFHAAVFHHDRSATAKTYLWMHPIYGGAMLLLELMGQQLRLMNVPWLARASIYVAFIYAVEFGTGYLLRRFIGRCPWDYGNARLAVKGLIRLDYAPAWFLAALLFDPMRIALEAALHAVTMGQMLAVAGFAG
jgi:uncharacterized membrane protein